MKKTFFFLSLLIVSISSYGQELPSDELSNFNLFLLPGPQIEVVLSLDSTNIVNPNTGFSITPGAQTIDMVAIFNESQLLQPKPYTPNPNTTYGRLQFKSDRSSSGFQLNNNNNFTRDFRSTNPAFFEANRNTALHRAYNPLSCYNTTW